MGGTCSKHGRGEKYTQNFGRKKLKGGDYSENLEAKGRIILEWIYGK
jgi:hypothetical protein